MRVKTPSGKPRIQSGTSRWKKSDSIYITGTRRRIGSNPEASRYKKRHSGRQQLRRDIAPIRCKRLRHFVGVSANRCANNRHTVLPLQPFHDVAPQGTHRTSPLPANESGIPLTAPSSETERLQTIRSITLFHYPAYLFSYFPTSLLSPTAS